MTLSIQDQKILSQVEHKPDMPAHDVARVLRTKAATVSYAIRKMRDRGVIKPRAFINSYRLGYTDVAVFFSLVDHAQRQRERLLKRIVAHEQIVYLGELIGDYRYILVLLCKNLGEVHDVLSQIVQDSGDVFAEKLVAPRVLIQQYARKYLDPKGHRHEPLDLRVNGPLVSIDELDHKILSVLGNSGADSLRQLASTIGAPFSTVERRVSQLQKNGVIGGFYFRVDEQALGVHAFRLLLMKKGMCNKTDDRLTDFCKNHLNITYLIKSIGAWDFEIGVEVQNPDQVNSVVEELYAVCGMRIAWVRVLMEGKTHKCSHYPFTSDVIQKQI